MNHAIKPTIIEKLEDLHKQATTERSHFYVASCCRDAIEEIKARDKAFQELEQAVLRAGFDVFVSIRDGTFEIRPLELQ